jgi:hypothetical protein
MTANELSKYVGTTIFVRFEDLIVSCVVTDAKTTFGRDRLLVRPTDGRGEQWIEFSRLVTQAA